MGKKLDSALSWAKNDKLSQFSVYQVSVINVLRVTIEDLIEKRKFSHSLDSISESYNSKFENKEIKVLKKHLKKLLSKQDKAHYLLPVLD